MVLCSTCTVRVLFLAKLWIGHFLAKLCAIGIIAEHSTEKWFKMMNFCRKFFFSGGFAKRSTRTVHLCNGGMLRAAAEKTFVRNRLRITDEFKHLKKSLFVHYLYRTSAAAQKTPLIWSHGFEPHFKMNNLVYATFKKVSFCIHFCHWWGLCVQYIICTEHWPRPRKLL